MKNKIVKDAAILTAFTLVLGLLLGFVYEITKEPIAASELAAEQAAYVEVFSEASSFEEYADFSAEDAAALLADNGYEDEILSVLKALDADGNLLGYVINVTAKDGSQANITLSMGIQLDGTVNGYSITDISETPGLGAKATEESFASQFQNKLVSAFSVVKTTPTTDSEIESITGATITSKAVANAVNACILYFQQYLGEAA